MKTKITTASKISDNLSFIIIIIEYEKFVVAVNRSSSIVFAKKKKQIATLNQKMNCLKVDV